MPFAAIRLLLAIRIVMESSVGPPLLERGSGASYITEAALSALSIPRRASDLDAPLFRQYRIAVLRQNLRRMREIEAAYRKRIGLLP
jgi:hypothetical protein